MGMVMGMGMVGGSVVDAVRRDLSELELRSPVLRCVRWRLSA